MSEYQYYEFLAMDRPLDAREMAELRGISTRADITPTHFSNEYSYGDLKADPAKLLERYFDVHVYVANWGTHRLAIRLPLDVAAPDDLATYCVGEGVSVRRVGEHTIIDLWSETEDYEGWVDGHGWMGSLAGVRAELMRGDQRPLYLVWLLGLDGGQLDDDDEEPPVPPGLGKLPASLASLIEFLRIDEHLVAAAAERSAGEQPEPGGMAKWIAGFPRTRRTACWSEWRRASTLTSPQPSSGVSGRRYAKTAGRPPWDGARCPSSLPAPTSCVKRRPGGRLEPPRLPGESARRPRLRRRRSDSTRWPRASRRRGGMSDSSSTPRSRSPMTRPCGS